MTNAIELIRVSTEAQASSDRASIPAQRSVNRSTAARYGLKIVKTIELSDVSGASVLLAPEIQRLIELIAAPDIGAVVTREFSRLMRPEKFSDYALLQAFADSRTKLYLPEGPIDFSEKTGRLMGTIRAAIAGLERSEIAERCWRGKEEKRKAGKKVSSTLPLGVGYDKQRGWFYTEDSRRVLQAYEMVLSGVIKYSDICNRTGISQVSIFDLLHNPIFKGWKVYDKKCDPAKRHTRADGRQGWSEKIPRSPEEIIRVQVIKEPLISPERWEAACRIMDIKRESHHRERGGHGLFYNGFLFCDTCGAPMRTVAAKKHHSRVYYVCRNRKDPGKWGPKCSEPYMLGKTVDRQIDELLSRHVSSPDFAKRMARQLKMRGESKRDATKIARFEAELNALETKRSRVVDSFVDGVLSRESRDERLRIIVDRIRVVSGELELLRQSEYTAMSPQQLSQAFAPFAEWEFLGREDRRRMLAVAVPRIKVHNSLVVGFYRLLDGCEVNLPRPDPEPQTGRTKCSYSKPSPTHTPSTSSSATRRPPGTESPIPLRSSICAN